VEGRFDLIAANAIEFNVFTDFTTFPAATRYWTLEEWKYLLAYLLKNNLKSPGRVCFELNYERDATGSHFNAPLMEFLAAHGAEVDFDRGRIDWRVQPAEMLAKIAQQPAVQSTTKRARQSAAIGD
jgi:hypothetical protein